VENIASRIGPVDGQQQNARRNQTGMLDVEISDRFRFHSFSFKKFGVEELIYPSQ